MSDAITVMTIAQALTLSLTLSTYVFHVNLRFEVEHMPQNLTIYNITARILSQPSFYHFTIATQM
jgi:hypothetical protein